MCGWVTSFAEIKKPVVDGVSEGVGKEAEMPNRGVSPLEVSGREGKGVGHLEGKVDFVMVVPVRNEFE